MYHCPRCNKGILDKQFVTQSVVFRKDMTYHRVLEKCISVVFPDDMTDSCEYYVSNGRGMPICSEEYIRVDNDEGVEELILWTLETYIKLSSIKYASKALLLCVALGGYHSLSSYQWSNDGCDLLGEVHPIPTVAGKYTCSVTSKRKSMKRHFEVKGTHMYIISHANYICWYIIILSPYI